MKSQKFLIPISILPKTFDPEGMKKMYGLIDS